jgi:hypothetical protein
MRGLKKKKQTEAPRTGRRRRFGRRNTAVVPASSGDGAASPLVVASVAPTAEDRVATTTVPRKTAPVTAPGKLRSARSLSPHSALPRARRTQRVQPCGHHFDQSASIVFTRSGASTLCCRIHLRTTILPLAVAMSLRSKCSG